MPAWTIADRRTGRAEVLDADRSENDGTGWSWWRVVVVVNTPRGACVRRVAAAELAGVPRQIKPD